MIGMRVNVVCRNWQDDRVLPRFSRYLRDGLGWALTRKPEPADVVYLMGYFESQMCKPWPGVPVAALFTHKEEEPPKNAKARLWDRVATQVDLRVAMCQLYAKGSHAGLPLRDYGSTVQMPLPVERDRFVISKRAQRAAPLRCGLSGYTYSNGRKGEDLVKALLGSKAAQGVEWVASGRGWPVKTKRYSWREMPSFYQALDVLVCTARVEGGPMTVLEALSCGVSVVVPRGVGILDELPDTLGIHRYKRGDAKDLVKAVGKATGARGDVDREALRAVTEGMDVAAWCRAHKEVFETAFGDMAGVTTMDGHNNAPIVIQEVPEPVAKDTNSTRGIYCVAFGDPARTVALRMMESAKRHMPEIPIALCSDRKIGPEDVLIVEPDSDIGGRRNKLRAYELAPAEWQSVLYLDADTEVVGDIRFYFELIEDGWEFVICKDPHLMDTMHNFRRRNNLKELEDLTETIFTLHTLQYNGGVWAFGRNERVGRFFARWLAEWNKYAGRDQGALIRAMYTEPLRVYLLGNEWNTFPKYTKGITTAGLMHYPGDARRWKGMINGRIDSPEAWKAVDRFTATHRGRRRV